MRGVPFSAEQRSPGARIGAITTRAGPLPSEDIPVRIHTGQPDHRQNRWTSLRRCALCPIQYGKLTIASLDNISLLLFIFSYNLAHWETSTGSTR